MKLNHQIKKKINILFSPIILGLLFMSGGCKKFVQVDPPRTQLVNSVVFNNDASATAAITGIYGNMIQDQHFASINTTYYAGMSADEMVDYSNLAANVQIYDNTIDPTNTNTLTLWADAYQYIYAANAVIEGLQHSTTVSYSFKQELTGEALFIRAFCTFYLVNLFGDIPLITSTNYQTNAMAVRTPVSEVYPQIISDLKGAQSSLSTDFSLANGERIRPTSWAATSLLARVYLYTQDWPDAEAEASSVLNNTSLFGLVSDPDSVFLANSTEAIWQLQPVVAGYDTWEGNVFILTANPSGLSLGVALSNELVQAFEPGDLRYSDWVNNFTDPVSNQVYYFPFKYKVKTTFDITEYYMMLRLGEQYLIRSEARAEQNNLNGALADLNIIRSRAGLPASSAADQNTVLSAIEQERRVELFAEWGHRWMDLKRTGQASSVLTPVKPEWKSTDVLYPVPQSERQNDPNLTQNPGYN